jgi:hypothetical protein
MKKIFYSSLVTIMFVIFAALQFPTNPTSEKLAPGQMQVIEIDFPENVKTLIERSCTDCHSDESGNFKAKGKLNFSKWNEYTPTKKVSRLTAICEEITDGKMPKKSYVKKHPEKALTAAEIETICKWTEEESKKIVGE